MQGLPKLGSNLKFRNTEKAKVQKERGIKKIREAANNLYRSGEANGGVHSPEWKAARVLNSLSNSLEFGSGLYGFQLSEFLKEYLEAE